jgi:hypothetical protein
MNRRCGQRCCTSLLYEAYRRPVPRSEPAAELGALGGTRTPNLLIRSQMLYPLSYERTNQQYTAAGRLPVRAALLMPVRTAVVERLTF